LRPPRPKKRIVRSELGEEIHVAIGAGVAAGE